MSKDDEGPRRYRLLEVSEKFVALLLDSKGRVKERAVFFIGAGCSREYGIPTTTDLARKYLKSDKGGLSQEDRDALDKKTADEIFNIFLQKFRTGNTINIEYAFFQELVEEARRKHHVTVSTYELLTDLWKHNYVDLILTTNFDELIEERIQGITVLDYRDIRDQSFPEAQDTLTLVKLAGDIRRSSMLWTAEDFALNISDKVKRWVEGKLHGKPIALMGYRAAEREIAEILAHVDREIFAILLGELKDASNLEELASQNKAFFYVNSTARDFLQAVTEKIYEKSKNTQLLYSFYAIRDKISSLSVQYSDKPDASLFVTRPALERNLDQFIRADQDGILVLLGESGHGKSHYLKHRAITADRESAIIYMTATEVPQGGINEWLGRLDASIDRLCSICSARKSKLTIILDGINELNDITSALALLAEALAAVDKHGPTVLKFVIVSRPEFWFNLADKLHRIEYNNVVNVDRFDWKESVEGLNRLGLKFTEESLKKHPARELLQVPAYQGLLHRLAIRRLESLTANSLFERLFDLRIASNKAAAQVVNKFCRKLAKEKAISILDFPECLRAELHCGFQQLIGYRILVENNLNITSFVYDTFGEYTFGRAYFHDFLFKSQFGSDNAALFVQGLLEEWGEISTTQLGYKIFFLNALKHFLLLLPEDQIDLLLHSSDNRLRQIVKEALFTKKTIKFRSSYRLDPFLVSISLLHSSNFGLILDELKKEDGRLISTFPLSIAGKLFPDALLRFISYVTRKAIKRAAKPGSLDSDTRQILNVLLGAAVIYLCHNGLPRRESHRMLFLTLDMLRHMLGVGFLAAKIEETVLENGRLLIYSDDGARIPDITDLPFIQKERLRKALAESAFSLDLTSMIELIEYNIVVTGIVGFIMIRDREDARLPSTLDALFESGSLRLQDFVLGIHGYLAKLDERHETILRNRTRDMLARFPHNFYKIAIDGSNDQDSQYDPLVPYASTKLLRNPGTILDIIEWDTSPNFYARLNRLFYKTAADFPEGTLKSIYELRRRGVEINLFFLATMKTIQSLHPEVYWSVTKTYRLADCFGYDLDDVPWDPKSVRQMRDWERFKIVESILLSPDGLSTAEKILEIFIDTDSFQVLIGELLKLLAGKAA